MSLLISGFACLTFPFCGLGFSFFSGPLVFLSAWTFSSDRWCPPCLSFDVLSVQNPLVAFVVWVQLHLSIGFSHSTCSLWLLFLSLFFVLDPEFFLPNCDRAIEQFFNHLFFLPFPLPLVWLHGKAMCLSLSFLFLGNMFLSVVAPAFASSVARLTYPHDLHDQASR